MMNHSNAPHTLGSRLAAFSFVAAATLLMGTTSEATQTEKGKDTRIVTVLRDEDCGSDAITRVKEVADRLGIEITIEEIIVANEEQAKALHWPGSPTVRIKGLDLERKARGNTSYAMT